MQHSLRTGAVRIGPQQQLPSPVRTLFAPYITLLPSGACQIALLASTLLLLASLLITVAQSHFSSASGHARQPHPQQLNALPFNLPPLPSVSRLLYSQHTSQQMQDRQTGMRIHASSLTTETAATPRFRLHSITGDGSCMFRAIVQGAHMAKTRGVPMSDASERLAAQNLRQAVVRELRDRREELEAFLPGIAEDWEGYLANMSLDTTWGGEPEMVMASNLLKTPLSVHRLVRGRAEPIITYGEPFDEWPIHLLWSGNHYDLLVDEDAGDEAGGSAGDGGAAPAA